MWHRMGHEHPTLQLPNHGPSHSGGWSRMPPETPPWRNSEAGVQRPRSTGTGRPGTNLDLRRRVEDCWHGVLAQPGVENGLGRQQIGWPGPPVGVLAPGHWVQLPGLSVGQLPWRRLLTGWNAGQGECPVGSQRSWLGLLLLNPFLVWPFCQGKTRIQLQVQLKYLLKSQNTRLGRGRGPGAVIEGKERWQEEVFSPIKPPVAPWGREGKA